MKAGLPLALRAAMTFICVSQERRGVASAGFKDDVGETHQSGDDMVCAL